jgi:hypothetical protein
MAAVRRRVLSLAATRCIPEYHLFASGAENPELARRSGACAGRGPADEGRGVGLGVRRLHARPHIPEASHAWRGSHSTDSGQVGLDLLCETIRAFLVSAERQLKPTRTKNAGRFSTASPRSTR